MNNVVSLNSSAVSVAVFFVFVAIVSLAKGFLASGLYTELLPLRVAHAGGAINGVGYTNSLEALDRNLEQGFIYFELDLIHTADGELICLHDWGTNFLNNFAYTPSQALTLAEFTETNTKGLYQNCTLASLKGWLSKNPGAVIITDVKDGSNLAALRKILTYLPQAEKRVIPQVYQPQNFQAIVAMGYKRVIWTVFQFEGDNQNILTWAKTLRDTGSLFAITMPKSRAITELPNKLKEMAVATYVHTINNWDRAGDYFANGITEVYTDSLPPKHFIAQ